MFLCEVTANTYSIVLAGTKGSSFDTKQLNIHSKYCYATITICSTVNLPQQDLNWPEPGNVMHAFDGKIIYDEYKALFIYQNLYGNSLLQRQKL